MDDSERLAEQYLLALGLGRVVFEPDGNIPPDFAVGGAIGVEVRRLNQNYQHFDGTTQGLEELSISLWQGLKAFLPGLGLSLNGESWFVCVDFRRPLEPWKALKAKIKVELAAFMQRPVRAPTTLSITVNFSLDILRASKDHGSFFLLGASSDDDSGGFIMGEVEQNIRLCIAEKERKIEPYRGRYGKWWLVLADHIDYSMELEDREIFRSEVMPRILHKFDRIVLIDPLNFRHAFEI